jgi:hypothetical protein
LGGYHTWPLAVIEAPSGTKAGTLAHLANDQFYKRIVQLFVEKFRNKGIKVGRYTGLTRRGGNRQNAESEVLASEPFFRDQPPHGLGWQSVPESMVSAAACWSGRSWP